MPKTEWAKNGTFSRKKWNGVPVLAAKNSTLLPKMELLFILAKTEKKTPWNKVPVWLPKHTLTSQYKLASTQFEAKDIFTIIFSDFWTASFSDKTEGAHSKTIQLFAIVTDFLMDVHETTSYHCNSGAS